MPSVVRIKRGTAIAVRDEPGLAIVKDDQAAGGGLKLRDQWTVTGGRWVDVQCCCGVHGVISLCGGRMREILTSKVILSNNLPLGFLLCLRSSGLERK